MEQQNRSVFWKRLLVNCAHDTSHKHCAQSFNQSTLFSSSRKKVLERYLRKSSKSASGSGGGGGGGSGRHKQRQKKQHSDPASDSPSRSKEQDHQHQATGFSPYYSSSPRFVPQSGAAAAAALSPVPPPAASEAVELAGGYMTPFEAQQVNITVYHIFGL